MRIQIPPSTSFLLFPMYDINETSPHLKLYYVLGIYYLFQLKFSYLGHYRVTYDNETWNLISEVLLESPTTIDYLNRAQVRIYFYTVT